MSFLDALPDRYRVILCDVWGVIHDGARLLPGAAARLREWRDEGRTVVLVTNAPRPAATVEATLASLGLPRDAWHAVASSGEAGIAALTDPPRPVGFLGMDDDLDDLLARGVQVVADGYRELAAAGLRHWRDRVDDYRDDLRRWRDGDVVFHCLNPDRMVMHDGELLVCPGALADAYEAIGGKVCWYGKPHPSIYRHALHLAGKPPLDAVLAVGDGLQTDVLGAARFGIDCLFVRGGIHGGEPFPRDFASAHGLGAWAPVGIVDSLA